MRLDRTGNTKRNIITGGVDKIVGILLPFIVRTMIIHLLGAEFLGLTGLFYSIVQMLNLAELGFGTAIVYSMYRPIAENDAKTINALLKLYAKIYRIVGVVILAAGLLILLFLPKLTRGETPPGINIYIVYLIFLVDSFMNCLLFPNRKALLAAFQREDVRGLMHIFTQTGMYLLQIVFIGLARDFYLYALTVPLSTCAFSLLCARQAKKIFGQYKEEGELAPEEYREIKKQVAGLFIRKVASLSRNAFDSMFVSAYLGLGITAVYGNYYYVMDAVVMLLAVVKTSMAGGVGNSIAMDPVEKNLRDMNNINFLFMCLSGWCAACLLCLYQPFMRLWAGEDMTLPVSMAVTFAVYFYVLKMSDIRTLYAESVGIWWQMRHLSVIEAAANLVMNWLFIRAFGLFGIILATLISYFVFNFIGGAWILYRHYFAGYRIGEYFLPHLKYAGTAVAAGAAAYGLCALVPFSGIAELALRAVLCIVVPPALYYIIYRKTDDYKQALPLIRFMLKMEKK